MNQLEEMPRSECADSLSDLGLSWLHNPEDTFSQGKAHIIFYKKISRH